MILRLVKKLILLGLILLIPVVIGSAVFLVWGYNYVTRDLPNLTRIEDYKPDAVTSVYSRDGMLVAEFYEQRRYPAKLGEIPLYTRNSFLAAEDASFYSHPGIDLISILRAFVKNIQTGSMAQGGSTITQQVVKNLLLTPEKKLIRKIKEAILSYRLEKRFSKGDILEMYLNQIFFGNKAYGIKAAAKLYFHKELEELSLAESALLAGLPKAPSRYSPISNMKRAKQRQHYVLEQMVRAGFIAAKEAEEAKNEEIVVHKAVTEKIYAAPYYVSEARRRMLSRWKDLDPDRDGLKIHLALDVKAQEIAMRSVRKGLREVDKRRGWRGPVDAIPEADRKIFLAKFGERISEQKFLEQELTVGMVTSIAGNTIGLDLGFAAGRADLKSDGWIKKFLNENEKVQWIKPARFLSRGDVIEVSLSKRIDEQKNVYLVNIDQTPIVESALVLVDPFTGEVPVAVGGYDYARSQFNRATQGKRQPGSSFKPILYLAAIDSFSFTPASIVNDSARSFRVGEDVWEPANFDHKYLGPITLRTALERSRNLVSADIISRIGVDAVIQYARKLGVESKLGRNPSLSLGSSEVAPLEIVRAYGVFAAEGVLFPSSFIRKIESREGEVIYDAVSDRLKRANRVISEESAFLMANMMKGVVQHGTGWKVRALKRPVAGKTGTSNDQMDAWFVGYTPQWACGVWVGFDQKKTIGKKETGGMAAAPIWLYFMKDFLEYQEGVERERLIEEVQSEATRLGIEFVEPEMPPPVDFRVPDGVDPYWIDKQSGVLVEPGAEGAFFEYFRKGTQPQSTLIGDEPDDYLSLPEL